MRGHVEHLVPFVHVEDMAKSTAFYALFGFEVRNTHDVDGQRIWCWLERGQARLMLARADELRDRTASFASMTRTATA